MLTQPPDSTSAPDSGRRDESVAPVALDGIRVLDLSRQAPGPYCSMLLADFGADVVLVEPPGGSTRGRETNAYWELERDPAVSAFAALRRNKRSVVLDLKDAADRRVMDQLVAEADILIEGFRPGTSERLGIGWPRCHERNPRLVYCSITGFGQHGPSARTAGHDINYLALSGVLDAITDRDGRPVIPLNLLADFGGGGLMAVYSIMIALFHRERTGDGQYIDVAMLDGTYSLLTHASSLFFARDADLRGGQFFLSGALPQYDTYACADGRWFAVGALEPWFYERLMTLTGRPDLVDAHSEPSMVATVRRHLTEWFAAYDSRDVSATFDGEDACVTPVLTYAEAMEHADGRGMVCVLGRAAQIGPAPRLSLTPASVRTPPPMVGEDTAAVLDDLRVR